MDQWTSSGEKSSTLQYGLHIDQTGCLLSISPQHFAQNRKVNNSPLHNVWAVSTALASGHPPVDKPTPLFSSQRLRPSRAFPLTDLSTIGSGDCRPRNAGICFKRRFGQIEGEENQKQAKIWKCYGILKQVCIEAKRRLKHIYCTTRSRNQLNGLPTKFSNYVRRLLVIGYCIGYWCANCAMFTAYGPGARFG